MIKEFDFWNEKKKQTNDRNPVIFAEKEIWWCSFGVNIGVEIDGKGKFFERPVVILKKLNRYSFIGLPYTSKETGKDQTFMFAHNISDRVEGVILLNQIKHLSASRLNRRMGKMGEKTFLKLKETMKAFI